MIKYPFSILEIGVLCYTSIVQPFVIWFCLLIFGLYESFHWVLILPIFSSATSLHHICWSCPQCFSPHPSYLSCISFVSPALSPVSSSSPFVKSPVPHQCTACVLKSWFAVCWLLCSAPSSFCSAQPVFWCYSYSSKNKDSFFSPVFAFSLCFGSTCSIILDR